MSPVVVIPALLIALAILDAAFAGFRAAAGRDGRIRKNGYYRRAVLEGGLAGAGLVVLLAALTVVGLEISNDAGAVYGGLLIIGERMLHVFVGYSTLVLLALSLYATASLELRTLATVAILGPFTMLRPWMVAAATAWGVAADQGWIATALTVVSSGAVLSLGWLLDRRYGVTSERERG